MLFKVCNELHFRKVTLILCCIYSVFRRNKMSVSSTAPLNFEESHALLKNDHQLQEALTKTEALDFSMLTRKLVEEHGWTSEFSLEVEDLYRKFLALNIRYPEKKICPTGPIDEFWHAHILDTRAYEKDCSLLFGQFLHHFPYFGMRGPEDRANLEAAFQESIDLFVLHYGIDPTAGDVNARSCAPQRCP
jgi:hypothetical protein